MNEILTKRQLSLVDFLTANPNDWHSQREIYENVEGYDWNESAYDKCSAIASDVDVLNVKGDFDGIIVLKKRMFKIGNEEEVKKYYIYHLKKLLKNAKLLREIKAKINRDGQCILPIDLDSEIGVLIHKVYADDNNNKSVEMALKGLYEKLHD